MWSADYEEVPRCLKRALAKEQATIRPRLCWARPPSGGSEGGKVVGKQYTLVATNVPLLGPESRRRLERLLSTTTT